MQQSARNFVFFKASLVNLQHTSCCSPSSAPFALKTAALCWDRLLHTYEGSGTRRSRNGKPGPEFHHQASLPPPFSSGTERLLQGDVKVWGGWVHPSASLLFLLNMYDFQHITPPLTHTHRHTNPAPFYQPRNDRLTRTQCFQCHSGWTWFLWDLWVSELKESWEKMCLCSITFSVVFIFVLVVFFFFFNKKNKKQWKKESKLNMVEMFQNHSGSSVVVFYVVK